MDKTIKTRNLEGRLNGPITDQIVQKFGEYCEHGEIDGVKVTRDRHVAYAIKSNIM
jgi:hypothetical protein